MEHQKEPLIMPYILDEKRSHLDVFILPLLKVLKAAPSVGDLNYCVTYLTDSIRGEVSAEHASSGKWNYQKINDVTGVLECAKLEFYRRLAAPYEDQKMANGDVTPYREFHEMNPNNSERTPDFRILSDYVESLVLFEPIDIPMVVNDLEALFPNSKVVMIVRKKVCIIVVRKLDGHVLHVRICPEASPMVSDFIAAQSKDPDSWGKD